MIKVENLNTVLNFTNCKTIKFVKTFSGDVKNKKTGKLDKLCLKRTFSKSNFN